MPFTGVSAMDCKLEFVRLAQAEGVNRRELCRRFGVSPTLGYRLLSRYAAQGESGLSELSRRPRGSPRTTPAAIEAAVMAVRAEHPAWGGRKIAAVLRRQGLEAPSPSTVTQILRRHGVALGAFGGGQTPFIINAFQRYGLPRRITADNGPPWGAGMRGEGVDRPWTALGVWLLEQDIALGHSRPYHPQTQGKDERFHRTLKAEALSGPPFANLEQAARRLRDWRMIYNTQRPHEALGLITPIERYAPSPRPYRHAVEPFAYGPDDLTRKVQDGRISFNARLIRVPKAFTGKTLALRPTSIDGRFDLVFRSKTISTIDLNKPV